MQNDYLDVLAQLGKAFSRFSTFSLGYGFGARTIPGEGPSSEMVSMTGDILNPYISNEQGELEKNYAQTLRTVRLALPVNFRNIIKMVCDMGQIEYGTISEV